MRTLKCIKTLLERRTAAAALAFYALLSFALFGVAVAPAPRTLHVGFSRDPSQMMWYMAWWPHAIAHGLNPFLTRAIWAPFGLNLTWNTSIPALALAFAPLTALFGPVFSYNGAALLAPALSAWTAFLLYCRVTSPRFAFAGGLVYGFSPYEVGQVISGHLSLSWVFVPPLCVLFVLELVKETISRRVFTVLATLLIVAQCLISTEILATMTLFGSAALAAAFALMPSLRPRLLGAGMLIVLAYSGAALILSPFLYYAFAPGALPQGFYPSSFFSADLLSFFVPTPLTLVQNSETARLASHLVGNLYENGAYFGLPLLILAAIYLWQHRREPQATLIAIVFGVIITAALGPVLHVNARAVTVLPWAFIEHFPLIRYALPVRFANYAFLILGMILSIYLAGSTARPGILALWVFATLFPNPLLLLHASHYEVPSFFARGTYRSYLRPGANLLVLPFGIGGPSMLWQADSKMYFNMSGGYTGLIPAEFQKWPLLRTLANSLATPKQDEQLIAFVQTYGIDAVVVEDGTGAPAHRLAQAIDPKPVKVGGISLYRVPRALTASPPPSRLEHFQRISADAWFGQLLCAAADFLNSGRALSELNPAQAQRLGLLPASQWADRLDVLIAGFGSASNNGMWVGAGPQGTIAIGLPAPGAAASAIADHYGAEAAALLFPYPARYAAVPDDGGVHFLLALMRPAAVGYCRVNPSHRLNLARQRAGF
jgi:hypothetical protein